MQNLQSFPRWLEDLKPQPMSWGGLTVWSAEIPVARLRPNTGQLPGIPENFKAMKKDELVSLLESIYAEKRSTTVLNENKPSVSAEHPTMKPVKLMARLIRNSTRKGDAVLDSFAGSGSTLIACEQIGRRCYALELDPHYCDVIIDRWEKMTGGHAEKIN